MEDQPPAQPTEQSGPTPEQPVTTFGTRAKELFQRASSRAKYLPESNSQGDVLTYDSDNSKSLLSHRLKTEGSQGTRDEESRVNYNPNSDVFTIDKVLTAADGSIKWAQIKVMGESVIYGSLTRKDPQGTTIGRPVNLGADHVQALLENIYNDINSTLDLREQGSSEALDADVADLLGLPPQPAGQQEVVPQ